MMADIDERLQQAINESAKEFARFWTAEMVKVEESVLDPVARWDILKSALQAVGRGRNGQ